jgi:hypothetical protein
VQTPSTAEAAPNRGTGRAPAVQRADTVELARFQSEGGSQEPGARPGAAGPMHRLAAPLSPRHTAPGTSSLGPLPPMNFFRWYVPLTHASPGRTPEWAAERASAPPIGVTPILPAIDQCDRHSLPPGLCRANCTALSSMRGAVAASSRLARQLVAARPFLAGRAPYRALSEAAREGSFGRSAAEATKAVPPSSKEADEAIHALHTSAASLRAASERIHMLATSSGPARERLSEVAKHLASSVGEGAGRVAAGLMAGEREFAAQTGIPPWAVRIITALLVMMFGTVLVAFSDEIKGFVGTQASKAVTEVLKDEEIRKTASVTAGDLLHQLLGDKPLQARATKFVGELVSDPETVASLQKVLLRLLADPSTRSQLVQLLAHPETASAIQSLLMWAIREPTTMAALGDLVGHLVEDEKVQLRVQQSLTTVLHRTLDDQELRSHASQTLAAVLADDALQKRTGDALWNAVTWSVTPKMFRPQRRGALVENPVQPPPSELPPPAPLGTETTEEEEPSTVADEEAEAPSIVAEEDAEEPSTVADEEEDQASSPPIVREAEVDPSMDLLRKEYRSPLSILDDNAGDEQP